MPIYKLPFLENTDEHEMMITIYMGVKIPQMVYNIILKYNSLHKPSMK